MESEVRRVWHEFGSQASADVVTLYSTLGGFQDYHFFTDDFYFSLWPWSWLQKRNREDRHRGVVFCDHSIESVTWELRFENEQTSSVWSSHGERTAPSLKSFLELYLEDPWQLL